MEVPFVPEQGKLHVDREFVEDRSDSLVHCAAGDQDGSFEGFTWRGDAVPLSRLRFCRCLQMIQLLQNSPKPSQPQFMCISSSCAFPPLHPSQLNDPIKRALRSSIPFAVSTA